MVNLRWILVVEAVREGPSTDLSAWFLAWMAMYSLRTLGMIPFSPLSATDPVHLPQLEAGVSPSHRATVSKQLDSIQILLFSKSLKCHLGNFPDSAQSRKKASIEYSCTL